MSHRVHPKILRIKKTEEWSSRWFEKKNEKGYLEEDFKIRSFLEKKLKEAGVEKIVIERFPGKTTIIISSSRPGLIIGRKGKGIEEMKKGLIKVLGLQGKEKRELKLDIKEVRDIWSSAELVAQWVARSLEKRTNYRRVLKQALSKIKERKGVKGARIEVAGRLNGVEISRTEWLKFGQLPRQTIRADIDYATARAYCTYGVIGVKVWIYKGEKFD